MAPAISPWWQIRTYTDGTPACRNGPCSSFDFTASNYCHDYWVGRASGAMAIMRNYGGSLNRQRILAVCAIQSVEAGPLEAELETYAFTLTILNSKTGRHRRVRGCMDQALFVLTSIGRLNRSSQNVFLTQPAFRTMSVVAAGRGDPQRHLGHDQVDVSVGTLCAATRRLRELAPPPLGRISGGIPARRGARVDGVAPELDDCGMPGHDLEQFACDTNTGNAYLVGSYAMFVPLDSLSANEILIDNPGLRADHGAWWQLRNYNDGTIGCRTGSTEARFDFPPPFSACRDYWAGRAVGGWTCCATSAGESTAHAGRCGGRAGTGGAGSRQRRGVFVPARDQQREDDRPAVVAAAAPRRCWFRSGSWRRSPWGSGITRPRRSGRWPLDDPPVATRNVTWGAIKSIYGEVRCERIVSESRLLSSSPPDGWLRSRSAGRRQSELDECGGPALDGTSRCDIMKAPTRSWVRSRCSSPWIAQWQ